MLRSFGLLIALIVLCCWFFTRLTATLFFEPGLGTIFLLVLMCGGLFYCSLIYFRK